MSTPTCLTIKFRTSWTGTGAPADQQLMFRSVREAKKAFSALYKGTQAFHNRANDREKMILVSHLSGEASIDVSEVVCFQYLDELKDGVREVVEEWLRGVGALHGVSDGARKRAEASECMEIS